MNRQHLTIVTLLLILAFTLGWTASRELDAERFIVTTNDDDIRAILGHDELGNGFLRILDAHNNEVFAVHHDRIVFFEDIAHTPAPPPPAPPVKVQELAKSTHLQVLTIEHVIVGGNSDTRDMEIRLAMESTARQREEHIEAGRKDEAMKKQQEIMDLLNELRQLRTSSGETRQKLTCWNGKQEVVLHTTIDMTDFVRNLPKDSFIQWNGVRRLGTSDLSFNVRKIWTCDKPDGFTMK